MHKFCPNCNTWIPEDNYYCCLKCYMEYIVKHPEAEVKNG
jgi:predicted nucleic acid-binding Zn ribbon protein